MTKQLTYINGFGNQLVQGADVDGDDSTALPAGTYVAKTVLASGSGMPAGVTAGYFFVADGTATWTPATGETVVPITKTKLCDLQSVTAEFNKEELDTTTLCALIKTIGIGLPDGSFSGDGITTQGITDASGGFLNSFIDRCQQALAGTITITEKSDSILYLELVLNDTVSATEEYSSIIVPIYLTTMSAGAAVGNAQTFSWSGKPASDDLIVPQLFVQSGV